MAVRHSLLLLAVACLPVLGRPAAAAERVDAGVLVCQVGASISMLVQSRQPLKCTFDPVSGPSSHYTGVIERVGIDLGVTGAGMMTWAVAALSRDIAPGALAGSYEGVSGDVALGIGVGANALVGTDRAVALNPLSVEGTIGASLALGVARLTLAPAP